MDDDFEDTQPATQQLPAHNGMAPSDAAGQDYNGIITFLHPCSAAALSLVRHAQSRNKSLVYNLMEPLHHFGPQDQQYNPPRRVAKAIEAAPHDPNLYDDEMDATQVDATHLEDMGSTAMSIDLALRYDPGPKNPKLGFVFGRNSRMCDVVLADPEAAPTDPEAKRVSNTHFRIYVNDKGALMLEDMSTNGTWVDHKRLFRNGPDGRKRVLSPGSTIMICPGGDHFIRFVVRIPKSGGFGLKSVRAIEESLPGTEQQQVTPKRGENGKNLPDRNLDAVTNGIAPPRYIKPRGTARLPAGIVTTRGKVPLKPAHIPDTTDVHTNTRRLFSGGTAWGGDNDYSLGDPVGKGAFATVYRAHERCSGDAVAVKVLPKRNAVRDNGNFNKEGVQKEVEILERLDHVSFPLPISSITRLILTCVHSPISCATSTVSKTTRTSTSSWSLSRWVTFTSISRTTSS